MVTELPSDLLLPSDFWERCDRYCDLLLTWNKTHKVTGIKSPGECRDHIVDSIYPLSFLPPFRHALDIGSGAGLPAIPLALARPDARFTLVEPLQKRYSFLTLVTVELGLSNVTVIPRRIEHVAPFPADLVTSRAVAPTPILLDLARPFSDVSTTYLFYKGERGADEASDLPHRLIECGERHYLILEGSDLCS